jgi:hypothetical protein
MNVIGNYLSLASTCHRVHPGLMVGSVWLNFNILCCAVLFIFVLYLVSNNVWVSGLSNFFFCPSNLFTILQHFS